MSLQHGTASECQTHNGFSIVTKHYCCPILIDMLQPIHRSAALRGPDPIHVAILGHLTTRLYRQDTAPLKMPEHHSPRTFTRKSHGTRAQKILKTSEIGVKPSFDPWTLKPKE